MVVIGRSQNGQADFARTLDGRLLGRFTGAAVAVDVLQHDDGIVDQTADSQGQAPEGKGIQSKIVEVEEDKGADDRDGNGEGDDHRAAQVAQEDQDHQNGQDRPHERLVLQALDGVPDVEGLIEELQHDHARGEQFLNPGQGLADVVHHLDGIGSRGLLHGQGPRPAGRLPG